MWVSVRLIVALSLLSVSLNSVGNLRLRAVAVESTEFLVWRAPGRVSTVTPPHTVMSAYPLHWVDRWVIDVDFAVKFCSCGFQACCSGVLGQGIGEVEG